MANTGQPAGSALIQRFCAAHRARDPDGPHVTVVDGVWSYCAGHAEDGHEWREIEARPRQQLESDIAAGLL
jgi:hypothetical protein